MTTKPLTAAEVDSAEKQARKVLARAMAGSHTVKAEYRLMAQRVRTLAADWRRLQEQLRLCTIDQATTEASENEAHAELNKLRARVAELEEQRDAEREAYEFTKAERDETRAQLAALRVMRATEEAGGYVAEEQLAEAQKRITELEENWRGQLTSKGYTNKTEDTLRQQLEAATEALTSIGSFDLTRFDNPTYDHVMCARDTLAQIAAMATTGAGKAKE